MNRYTTRLDGVIIIETDWKEDSRGYFTESYNCRQMEQLGVNAQFIQDNESLSLRAGTIRGLHYQCGRYTQAKLVRVLSGVIFDVVVDLRKGSRTYGQWTGVVLSEANRRQLFVPRGFAHGICTLTDHARVLYKVDQHYRPEADRGIIWNDPDLGIEWPISSAILSDKDRRLPRLAEIKPDEEL